MNGITHKQAKRYLLADLDGLLSETQRRDLETHLRDCEACRVESQTFSTLTTRLQSEFHSRWDAHDGPSKNVLKNIQAQKRRITMSNRINLAFKALGGIAALLVLGFAISAIVSQLQKTPPVANATQIPEMQTKDRVIVATPTNAAVDAKPTLEPYSFTQTVAEAEALAGFDVLEPAHLPAGYVFDGAFYEPQSQKVAMKFVSQDGINGTLYIYQQRGEMTTDPSISAYVTPVAVGNAQGEYVRGAWVYDSPGSTPTWDPHADFYSLSWQKDGFVFSISFLGGETIPPIFLEELIVIAESLK